MFDILSDSPCVDAVERITRRLARFVEVEDFVPASCVKRLKIAAARAGWEVEIGEQSSGWVRVRVMKL